MDRSSCRLPFGNTVERQWSVYCRYAFCLTLNWAETELNFEGSTLVSRRGMWYSTQALASVSVYSPSLEKLYPTLLSIIYSSYSYSCCVKNELNRLYVYSHGKPDRRGLFDSSGAFHSAKSNIFNRFATNMEAFLDAILILRAKFVYIPYTTWLNR